LLCFFFFPHLNHHAIPFPPTKANESRAEGGALVAHHAAPRLNMAPTLRPRGGRKGEAETPAKPASVKPRSTEQKPIPPERSFALSSSGWLFVYYVGVVKALAERGYHKCVTHLLSSLLPRPPTARSLVQKPSLSSATFTSERVLCPPPHTIKLYQRRGDEIVLPLVSLCACQRSKKIHTIRTSCAPFAAPAPRRTASLFPLFYRPPVMLPLYTPTHQPSPRLPHFRSTQTQKLNN
jgi:hypothetical protein